MPCNKCDEPIVFGVGYCPKPKPCVIMRYCEKHYGEEKKKKGQKCVFCQSDILWAQEEDADRIIRGFGPAKDFAASQYNELPVKLRREIIVKRGEKGKNEKAKSPNVAQMPTLSITERIKIAVDKIETKDLAKNTIMTNLQDVFKGELFEATKKAEFAEALLEEIRSRQSERWKKATEIIKVLRVQWNGGDLVNWDVRHYTSKVMVTLGKHLGDGYFGVAKTEPPPFMELLSSITLSASPETNVSVEHTYHEGDRILMTNTAASSTSGHTTAVDWAHIGNVGDTFYALFYGNNPANDKIPGFIRDAVYCAQWSVEEFGVGWASADWLATAQDSKKEAGQVPTGGARKGQVSDIIADIFPAAATRKSESSDSKAERISKFGAMENFEIKKHGPMGVKNWDGVPGNLKKLENYIVDTRKIVVVFVKLISPFKLDKDVIKEYKEYIRSKKV